MRQRKAPPCPNCKSVKILPIVYGYPTDEVFREAEKGHLILGGCLVMQENPDWYCKKCDLSYTTAESQPKKPAKKK